MNGFETGQLELFSMILMRMSGFVFLNPLIRRSEVPTMAKSGLAFAMALLLYPTASVPTQQAAGSLVFGVTLLGEFAVGAFLGFIMDLFLYVVTQAGAIIDFQMGMSMATVYDAGSKVQSALSGTFLHIYFVFLFFAVDGHLALVKIITEAAEIFPYGGGIYLPGLPEAMIEIFLRCTVLSVQLAFPMIAIEFVGELAIGILMKIIPQINIFILSIQMKIVVGLFIFVIMISPIGDFMGDLITEMMNTMLEAVKLMAA